MTAATAAAGRAAVSDGKPGPLKLPKDLRPNLAKWGLFHKVESSSLRYLRKFAALRRCLSE